MSHPLILRRGGYHVLNTSLGRPLGWVPTGMGNNMSGRGAAALRVVAMAAAMAMAALAEGKGKRVEAHA